MQYPYQVVSYQEYFMVHKSCVIVDKCTLHSVHKAVQCRISYINTGDLGLLPCIQNCDLNNQLIFIYVITINTNKANQNSVK